ncbi:MAG: penicillin-binding protein 1A [Candidatus Nitrospinota bacterium M3_3B_026]
MRLFRRNPLLFLFLASFAVLFGSFLGLLVAMYHDLPKVRGLEEYRPNVVTRILDSDDRRIAELFREKRFWVSYDDVPRILVDAVLATEDDEFFEHKGIRFLSILRALLVDIRMGRMAQGGSTITQQLAKQLFLTPEKNVIRKIKEALLAIQVEKRYTKREILELYLNQIYLGAGAYGVEAAAQVYFGKSVKDLDLAEAALIAGLPRAPSRYSPFENKHLARQRRATVLSRMRAEGYITKEAEARAAAEPILLNREMQEQAVAGHFVEMVRKYLEETYGTERVYREGLIIRTTLDMDLQAFAAEAVKKGAAAVNERVLASGLDSGGGPVEAALVAIRPEDGAILALVGGTDFERSKFNRAVQAKRQPGSAFKPFVYLAALEKGYSPADIIIDSPVSFPRPGGGGAWKPVNFSNRFYGPVTLRKALENSLNVATVKLLDRVGLDAALDAAWRAGIRSPLPGYLSVALGSGEVTPLELTSAYATLANRGLRAKPRFIVSVTSADGEILEENDPVISDAVRPEEAYVLTNMLKGVVDNGTGKIAGALDRPVAAKTGTTSGFKDAWFAGYTPGLAAGVWVGFDDGHPLGSGETGGHTAGPIWVDFMSRALRDRPVAHFRPPERIAARLIDRDSGKLATAMCENTMMEIFVEGTEPVEYCGLERTGRDRL